MAFISHTLHYLDHPIPGMTTIISDMPLDANAYLLLSDLWTNIPHFIVYWIPHTSIIPVFMSCLSLHCPQHQSWVNWFLVRDTFPSKHLFWQVNLSKSSTFCLMFPLRKTFPSSVLINLLSCWYHLEKKNKLKDTFCLCLLWPAWKFKRQWNVITWIGHLITIGLTFIAIHLVKLENCVFLTCPQKSLDFITQYSLS